MSRKLLLIKELVAFLFFCEEKYRIRTYRPDQRQKKWYSLWKGGRKTKHQVLISGLDTRCHPFPQTGGNRTRWLASDHVWRGP